MGAEFSEESKVAAHAVLDTAARTVNANGKRTQTESGRIESTFECDGSDTPHLPEHLVWLEVEPTWREVVAGRLSATNRIRSFTVLIHLDQAAGVTGTASTARVAGGAVAGDTHTPSGP